MRRAMIALVGTATGTILLVGAKAGLATGGAPATVPVADEPAAGQMPSGPVGSVPAAPPAPGPAQPGASAAPAGTSAPTAPGSPATRRTPPAGGATTPAPPPTPRPPARSTPKDGTFAGDPIYTDYGPVEVSIVVTGGRLVDVRVLDSPSEEARSRQLSRTALPRLRQAALAAQSASIDTVSGATYTSEGYIASLQSALDKSYRG